MSVTHIKCESFIFQAQVGGVHRIPDLDQMQRGPEANLVIDDIYTESSNWPLILLIALKD